ncbi:MAG: hypothetical protein U0H96_07520 [Christensenellales bacterium]|nr:hypothetical protein [Christensenellales bacterium]
MFLAPFSAARFPLDVSQHFLGDFTDRRSKRRQRLRRIPFEDGREIFRLEPMFFRQSTAAQQRVLDRRCRRIAEGKFEVEFIIPHKQRTVNDGTNLVLMFLPVIHDALHRNFFELTCKSTIGRDIVFLFQHGGNGHFVFFMDCPGERRSGVLTRAGVRHIKNIVIARHIAGHIQQRDTFCAAPDISPHGIRPQLKRRAGGRVRALGVDHHLVVKTIFVQGGSRLQKRAPRFPIGGDLARGLRGKLYIIIDSGHFIVPRFLS